MTSAGDPHLEVSELLEAFVLDAVDHDEAEIVEKHLDECHRCRAEVDQLREIAAAIGSTSAPPPDALWDRIAGRLEVRRRTPSGRAHSVDRSASSGARSHAAGAAPELPGPLGVSPNRQDRRFGARSRGPRGRRVWTAAIVGTAAACAALAAVFGVSWSTASGRVSQLEGALARQGMGTAVDAALASPGHRVVELQSGAGTRLAELVVRRDGTGYVVRSRMPALPGDETYQLWAEIAGQPISLGLLGSKPALGAAFSLGPSVGAARELMVTVEPSGGVVTPDRGPIATAALD